MKEEQAAESMDVQRAPLKRFEVEKDFVSGLSVCTKLHFMFTD